MGARWGGVGRVKIGLMEQPKAKKRKISGICEVCCEKYTVKARRELTCGSCTYSCCSSCIEKWILSQPSQEANCIKCHEPWTDELLREHLTSSFIRTDYKKHRENILYERELALLPESQIMVTNYHAHEKLKASVAERNALIKDLRETINQLKFQNDGDVTGMASLRHDNFRGPRQVLSNGTIFVHGCTMTDCRGFLNLEWKCGVCNSTICKDCREENGPDHQCDPDIAATILFVQADSKPCPKCHVSISKVDGCK